MFLLSDRARRWICVAVLLVLGVLPTAWITAWCAARHLPGRVAAEADRLGRDLGLTVTLASLEYPTPGRVRYSGLRLANPETGRPAIACRTVEAAWARGDSPAQANAPQSAAGPVLQLTLSGLEIEAGELGELVRLAGGVLQSRTGLAEPRVQLAASQAVLRSGDDSRPLGDVEGLVETFSGDRLELRLSCESRKSKVESRGLGVDAHDATPDVPSASPVRLRIVRLRQTAPPRYAFELDARESPVPCSLLALGLPGLESLGSRSRFQGYLWAEQSPEGWRGELGGRLLDVELETLAAGWTGHRLAGPAQIAISRARFARGRLEEASGQVEAGPGLLGTSLLAAAQKHLRLTPGDPATQLADPIPYEHLWLAFSLGPQGLRLEGRSGTVLADRSRRLLGEPLSAEPVPLVALVRALMAAEETPVPISRTSTRLLGWLPLPDPVSTAATQKGPSR